MSVLYYSIAPFCYGYTLLARTDNGIHLLLPGNDPGELFGYLHQYYPGAVLVREEPDDSCHHPRIQQWFETPCPLADMPLVLTGTAFQQRVWQVLQTIPIGHTRSYQSIARELDKPGASRAVAGACAANRLALLIPCHRVIHSDGSLSGYRWGVPLKRWLLEREAGFGPHGRLDGQDPDATAPLRG